MCTVKRHGRCGEFVALGLLIVGLLAPTFAVGVKPAAAQTVTVRAVDRNVVFDGTTSVAVEIVVENVTGVAGLQFSIDYPSTLISTEAPTTHTSGGLWETLVVNHDNVPAVDPPAPGFRRISVAAAAAEGRTVDSGLLMTVQFEVGCYGFAQDWPDGRSVTLDVRDVRAFDETATAVDSIDADGTLLLDCDTVGVDDGPSFGTLKARYDATPGKE